MSTVSPIKFNETPIVCPHCEKESGYVKEGLMLFVVVEDLRCKNCGEIVIHKSPIYSTLGTIHEC